MIGIVVTLFIFVFYQLSKLSEKVDGFHEETREIRERLAVLETKFEFRTAQQTSTLNRVMDFRKIDQE